MSARKIIELRAANVKRLTAVEIKPDGTLVVIGGKNCAGKSSVLDAIVMGLGGAKYIPGKPVRTGAESADIEMVLDGEPGIVIKRHIKADGGTTLEVTQVSADGVRARIQSPQALLDTLCGRIAFDPLAFTRLRPQEQVDVLRQVVGIDLSDVDVAMDETYQQRTALNRQVKEQQSVLTAAKSYADAPAEAVSVDALLAELEEAGAVNRAAQEAEQQARVAAERVPRAAAAVAGAKKDLLRAQEIVRTCEALLKTEEAAHDEAQRKADAAKRLAADKPRIDCEPIHARLRSAEATNEKVRANASYQEMAAKLAELRRQSEEATARIEALRAARVERINAAKWPVTGLGFTEDGVSYNGLPFGQCSSAEQLRISTAIGLAQHPNLRVLLIKDASLLDDDSLAAIAELAAEHEGQVWLEVVRSDESVSVIIEDGRVKGADGDAQEQKTAPVETAAAEKGQGEGVGGQGGKAQRAAASKAAQAGRGA